VQETLRRSSKGRDADALGDGVEFADGFVPRRDKVDGRFAFERFARYRRSFDQGAPDHRERGRCDGVLAGVRWRGRKRAGFPGVLLRAVTSKSAIASAASATWSPFSAPVLSVSRVVIATS
jgi:hypothetical protein